MCWTIGCICKLTRGKNSRVKLAGVGMKVQTSTSCQTIAEDNMAP